MNSFSIDDVLGVPLPTIHVVDVGASMVEGADHYAPLVERGLCQVTGFEPDPTQFQALQDSGREHYAYLPYALGDGNPGTFFVAKFPGCSSLYPPNRSFIDMYTAIGASPPDGNFSVVSTVPIDTRRLDDIDELQAVDFMKLDVQGAEVTVLGNATQTLKDVLVLESEVLFVPLYEGQGDFADLTQLLKEQGFMLLEMRDVHKCSVAPFLTGGTTKAPFGQWMWADAVYVRAYDDLSTWSGTELLKAAMILHEVYAAYDLVHHLLMEHERRTFQPTAARYRAAIGRTPGLNQFYPVAQSAWNRLVRAS